MTEEKSASGWNYQPSEPIKYNPLFDLPPKLGSICGWMVKRWVSVSRFVLFLIAAVILTLHFTPSLSLIEGSNSVGSPTYSRAIQPCYSS